MPPLWTLISSFASLGAFTSSTVPTETSSSRSGLITFTCPVPISSRTCESARRAVVSSDAAACLHSFRLKSGRSHVVTWMPPFRSAVIVSGWFARDRVSSSRTFALNSELYICRCSEQSSPFASSWSVMELRELRSSPALRPATPRAINSPASSSCLIAHLPVRFRLLHTNPVSLNIGVGRDELPLNLLCDHAARLYVLADESNDLFHGSAGIEDPGDARFL